MTQDIDSIVMRCDTVIEFVERTRVSYVGVNGQNL